MSYFNELAGKPDIWSKYLLGSAIDWGQDAYWLNLWCENNSEIQAVYVFYDSTIPLNRIGFQMRSIPEDLEYGRIIFGVNNLFRNSEKYVKYKKIVPNERIGLSIVVFENVTKTDE
jgi:hypothetical protein